jgi:hypothetical protein
MLVIAPTGPSSPQFAWSCARLARESLPLPDVNANPTQPFGTLELVRQLHEDETLTEEGAMQLATHLNEHEGARRSWPGNMLFDFFLNVYEDGNMRLYELEALAHILEGILIHADGMAAEAAETVVEETVVEDDDEDTLVLPNLSELDDLGCNVQPGLPEMYFSETMCDCLDWQTARRKLPSNSPGRLCKHLCCALYRNLDHLPSRSAALRGLVLWGGSANRALAPQSEWRVVIHGESPVIAAWGAGNTCEVYALGDNKTLEAFSYSLIDRQWNYGRRPRLYHDDTLKRFLVERVAEFAERRSVTA